MKSHFVKMPLQIPIYFILFMFVYRSQTKIVQYSSPRNNTKTFKLILVIGTFSF